MAKFHSIKVLDIYKETKDCLVISFDIPAELKQDFSFKQGQHITLRAIYPKKSVIFYLISRKT